jgi:hypothetical protein
MSNVDQYTVGEIGAMSNENLAAVFTRLALYNAQDIEVKEAITSRRVHPISVSEDSQSGTLHNVERRTYTNPMTGNGRPPSR